MLRLGSAVSIVIYGILAAVLLARADLMSPGIPEGIVRPATWVIAAYFFLGIGMNPASRSKPERAVMAPLSVQLCTLCAVIAIS